MAGADSGPRADQVLTRLFPSLGFFGGNDQDALVVPLGRPVDRIVLRLPESDFAALDLRGVRLLRDKKVVNIAAAQRHVRQSSRPAESSQPTDAFAQQGIRSDSEYGPWWMVRFDAPVMADALRVYNRADRYGYRVRQLIIEVAGPGQGWHQAAAVGGDADVDQLAQLVAALTGIDLPARLAEGPISDTLRAEVMSTLADRARRDPLVDDLDSVRMLLALIPTGHGRDRPQLSEDEYAVLAHLLAAQFAYSDRTPTSVAAFGFALDTRTKLDQLATALATMSQPLGLPPMLVTRHGLRAVGALSASADAYLDLIDKARADFADLGLPLMLGYGTLLGAIREADFLPHDDDVDMLYPLEAESIEAARPSINQLCAELRRRGWRIWQNSGEHALNFHLIEIQTGRRLDLFPVITHQDRVILHMERMRLRTVPRELLLPAQPHTFLSRRVDVPANPEGFLAERYGPSWRVSDPYDDWPWPLDERRAAGAR